jgi:DNA-binding NarL/FixJ family response regulator
VARAAPALCLRGGVSGFVDKIHTANGLLPVIETVLAGNKSLPTEWGSTSPAKVFKLNTSQQRVLERILANPYERNQSIAKKISLSLSTGKKKVSLLLRFFDCETRFELAHEAERCGFLPEITQPSSLQEAAQRNLRFFDPLSFSSHTQPTSA